MCKNSMDFEILCAKPILTVSERIDIFTTCNLLIHLLGGCFLTYQYSVFYIIHFLYVFY